MAKCRISQPSSVKKLVSACQQIECSILVSGKLQGAIPWGGDMWLPAMDQTASGAIQGQALYHTKWNPWEQESVRLTLTIPYIDPE